MNSQTQMPARATLQDVAREANVSSATVDRVLNGRDGVRARTREVVLQTARRLGYISDSVASAGAGHTAQPAPILLSFLLPAGTNAFINALHHHITAQAATRPELSVHVERIEGFNPQTVAAHLLALRGKAAGVGLIAQDHPLVREAIRTLAQSGCHVLTLATDIQNTPRLAYIGIDTRQAGRLAGQLMGRLLPAAKPAKAALFAGSLAFRGHEVREMGVRHILREEFPHIQILELREIMDDRQRAQTETKALLEQHPDLAAIYNVGGGTSGIATELRARKREHQVVFLCHEATESNKAFILDGTVDAVIDQNPRVEAREAVRMLISAVQGRVEPEYLPRVQIILRENIPSD